MRRPTDPLGAFRFRLELGSIDVAGFSEASGLNLETKVYELREGGRNDCALKFPESGSVGNITLKRGVTTGANGDALLRWHEDVRGGTFAHANQRPAPDQPESRHVAVVLRDEAGTDVKRWVLHRAFPVKWTGPDLKAAASEVAIESLELACEDIELARGTA